LSHADLNLFRHHVPGREIHQRDETYRTPVYKKMRPWWVSIAYL
jgi:hypothetical protein